MAEKQKNKAAPAIQWPEGLTLEIDGRRIPEPDMTQPLYEVEVHSDFKNQYMHVYNGDYIVLDQTTLGQAQHELPEEQTGQWFTFRAVGSDGPFLSFDLLPRPKPSPGPRA